MHNKHYHSGRETKMQYEILTYRDTEQLKALKVEAGSLVSAMQIAIMFLSSVTDVTEVTVQVREAEETLAHAHWTHVSESRP